ncbi:NACHT, LRR and PYD domains-containing protein 3-like [Hyperolius riggenbachi]|uniref:NACHT, LRR and PYD domains-containing protein 3-like n=1 Tax=Hyperolius riggenbachi TaxID=752182 RepID=UPI0035A2CB46
MEFRHERVVSSEDIRAFQEQLSAYDDASLRFIYEYFRGDLSYVLETLDTVALLSELKSRNVIHSDSSMEIKKSWGAELFVSILLQDILEVGREAVIGLLVCLFVLQVDHPHPNLLAILGEIGQTGENLMPLILLDQFGHTLPSELNGSQEHHKTCLLEETQMLQEPRALGYKQEGPKFLISQRYLDLIVVSSKEFRNRSTHEVIETGGKHEYYLQKAQNRLERITANRLFRWCHRSGCVPCTVMVSGVPGVGKTTLMQKIVYDWVTGKHYKSFAFVFFFKFRELNICQDISLEEMIVGKYPYLHSHISYILQNPEKLLFIFDGLDESSRSLDFRVYHQCISTQQRRRWEIIVASLANQSLLKGCSVLMTSRPAKLASLEFTNFQRMSEIMGFFPKEREKYFEQVFENKSLSEKAFQYVRENDTLYTFCYIPTYCWIVCSVLSKCFVSAMAMNCQPKTITQLFVTYVANILQNHTLEKDNPKSTLQSLGRMAEHGIMNHVLTFHKDDWPLFSEDTCSGLLSSFLVESSQRPCSSSTSKSPAVTYSFLHLTVQEFFSAMVHFLDYSEDRMKASLSKAVEFDDGRCEIFLRFLCGLSDLSTRAILKPYVGEFSNTASKLVIAWLMFSAKKIIEKTEKDNDDKRKLMNLFNLLFETRNKPLVKECLKLNKKIDFSEHYLTPVDCTVLAFILQCSEETKCLDLDTCFIQSEGFKKLAPYLHIIEDLRLSKNDLKDDDAEALCRILSHPTCRVKRLILRENSFLDQSCTMLAQAIYKNSTLEELDLSKNNLMGKDFHVIIEALSNPTCTISKLWLQQVKMNDQYSPCLRSLGGNPNLELLDLGLNYLTDNSGGYIKELIERSKLRELRINTNDFSKQAEETLKSLERIRPGLQILL